MRTVVRRGEGELLTIGRDRTRPVEILIEPVTTGCTAFTMGAQTLPPGGEVPVHRHPEEEILFFYSGSGRVTVGDVVHEVGPETAVFIPGDTYHGVQNTGAGELRVAFTLSPAGYENVFRALARGGTDHPAAPAQAARGRVSKRGPGVRR